MTQNIPKTVWSSEDGDLRKKQPPHFDKLSATPASPKSDTESLENIKSLNVGRFAGGGVRRTEGVNSLPPQQQTVYLHRESKGRGGKAVTLIKGLALSEADMSALAKKIKKACGSGGTGKDGVIEIQGEHREAVLKLVKKFTWPPKT